MALPWKEVQEFILQYFEDEPNASISDCVRDALAVDVPVTPEQVSGVRRRLREELAKRPKAPPPPITPIPQEKYRRSEWVAELTPAPPEPEPTPEEKKAHPLIASVTARRRYYEDVLLEDPSLTVTQAMKKVTAKYGRSVDPNFAVAVLREVRELATKVQPLPNAPKLKKEKPAPTPVVPQKVLEPEPPNAPPEVKESKSKIEPDETYLLLFRKKGLDMSYELVEVRGREINGKAIDLISSQNADPKTFTVVKKVAQLKMAFDFE